MRVFFRADGNAKIGMGHIMRCLALAEVIEKYFDCYFIIRNPDKKIIDLIEATKNLIKISATSSLPDADIEVIPYCDQDDIVVIDGYHFDTLYQQKIKDHGCKLICIDDLQSGHFVANIIINHGCGLNYSDYSTEPYTKIFLGPQYAMINKVFGGQKRSPVSRNVLITFGGSDPQNYTLLSVKRLLEKFGDTYDYHIITGPGYSYKNELKTFTENKQISLYEGISASQVAFLMQSSAICIAQPSTVAIEYLSCSLGHLIIEQTADNQQAFFKYLIQENIAMTIDDLIIHDKKLTTLDKHKASTTFDGKSAERLLMIFKTLVYA